MSLKKIKDFIVKKYTEHLNEQVEKYWLIYQFDMEYEQNEHTSHNNEGDAFKHTYMSAELSMWLGESLARKIVYAHEDWPGNPIREKRMDLNNDDVGLGIARLLKPLGLLHWLTHSLSDAIAEEVILAIKSGSVITDLSDERCNVPEIF